jgi:hypothetical protein
MRGGRVPGLSKCAAGRAARAARAARDAGVSVAAGDTKVVERGAADRAYGGTAAIGLLSATLRAPMRRIAAIAVVSLAAAGAASAATVPGLRAPSGVSCVLASPTALLCTVAKPRYAKALQARCAGSAGLDWHGFVLSATKAGQVSCSGGTLVTGTERTTILPYGKTWKRGPFTCAAATNAVICRTRAGHGVAVSRRAWRVW